MVEEGTEQRVPREEPPMLTLLLPLAMYTVSAASFTELSYASERCSPNLSLSLRRPRRLADHPPSPSVSPLLTPKPLVQNLAVALAISETPNISENCAESATPAPSPNASRWDVLVFSLPWGTRSRSEHEWRRCSPDVRASCPGGRQNRKISCRIFRDR